MENHQNPTVDQNKLLAIEKYEQGAEAWKNGNRAVAMNLYAESAELDPEGPGATALKMSNEIMDFYDKNQFNP